MTSAWIRRTTITLLLLGHLGVAPCALAGESIAAVNMRSTKQRMDGMLREWPTMKRLSVRVSGGGDPAAKGLIGYDSKNLYVAMDIKDANFVRTSAFGQREDFATLLLAFPKPGGGYRTYYVLLYPGDPGRSAGLVKFKHGSAIRSAKLVEMPLQGGLSFEASIPWSAFPESSTVRVGLHAALRYDDEDGGKKTIIATSAASTGASLPPLLLESEYSLFQALIYPKHLSEKPKRQVTGNVAGSKLVEHVALYERYLTIVGPGYRKGKEFYFQDLAVESPSDVTRLELRDLTDDGHADIVLQKRVGTRKNHREVLQVWSISPGSDEPFLAFQHEVGITIPHGSISNKVSLSGGKVTISQGTYTGVDPDTYNEPMSSDMGAALLPWERVQSRTYKFKDGKFELDDEKTGKPRVEPKKRARLGHGPGPSGGSAGSSGERYAGAEPPPPPRPPTAEEKLDAVYKLYRRDQGVPPGRPRFDFVTDVAEDAQPERVLVHGKDIVAFGKGFKGGSSYVYLTLGFKEAKHILAVTARDLTGDGKAEIIVRGIIEATASKKLGGDTIQRHALFIYKVQSSGIKRIFAAETGRSLGDKAIIGNVVFRPAGIGVDIELRPGRAIGWTQETYPFPPDRHPYAGLEPLLLPWTDMDPRRYQFTGNLYSQQ